MDENRNSIERFLVVQGTGPAWAIRAAHVARFTTLASWQGGPPLTATWSESASTDTSATRRLMVFRTPRGEQAIHITGTVTPRDVEAPKVNALPAPCWPSATAALVVSAIAIDGEAVLFLIVEPSQGG